MSLFLLCYSELKALTHIYLPHVFCLYIPAAAVRVSPARFFYGFPLTFAATTADFPSGINKVSSDLIN